MFIDSQGSGPELVLLHGWGLHGGSWAPVLPQLAQNFCVHVVDLPGFGRSPRRGSLTLAGVCAELDALFPRPVTVLGWSLGGLFALEWARLNPSKVERLVLVASSPCFRVRADWPCAMDDAVLQAFAGQLQQDFRATLRRFLALQALGDDFARQMLRGMEATLFAHGEPDMAALEDGLHLLQHIDSRATVPSLPQPMLLLYGAKDRLVPPAAAVWLAQAAADARLQLFDQCAHAPHWSQPVEFCEAVKDFCHE